MAVQKKLIILAITAMFMEVTMAATTYTVGSPNGGWDTSTDLTTWASTQSFLVGDSLMFQYTPNHDVLEVDKADYDLCQTSNPINSDNSGTTTIPLSSPGKRYFICGTNGHCGQGMKVEIDTVQVVTSAPPPPPPPSPSTPPPTSPSTPPPASSPSPPAASPVSPPVSSPPPKASTPSPQSKPPMSSPPPSLTVPSTESPTSTPAPSALVPPPPPSSAHKCSFQATLAMGVGFVMVFLAL